MPAAAAQQVPDRQAGHSRGHRDLGAEVGARAGAEPGSAPVGGAATFATVPATHWITVRATSGCNCRA